MLQRGRRHAEAPAGALGRAASARIVPDAPACLGAAAMQPDLGFERAIALRTPGDRLLRMVSSCLALPGSLAARSLDLVNIDTTLVQSAASEASTPQAALPAVRAKSEGF